MKVNYVIAAYFGPRLHVDMQYAADPFIYLREQFASLRRLRHELDQVTVMVAGDMPNRGLPQEMRSDTLNGASLVVIRRPNVGYSYGGYSDAFAKYRETFTHYIFNEDDWIFTQDNFDRFIVDKLDADPDLGLLASVAFRKFPDPDCDHGANPLSYRSCVLAKMAEYAGGRLPFDAGNLDDHWNACLTQIEFGRLTERVGYKVSDWCDVFSYGYRGGEGPDRFINWYGRQPGTDARHNEWFGDLSKPALVVAAQSLDSVWEIRDGRGGEFSGEVQRDGTIKNLVENT